jgi:hypothetical protein
VNYYLGRVWLTPGGVLVLRGQYPHARYISFNVYDETFQPTDVHRTRGDGRLPAARPLHRHEEVRGPRLLSRGVAIPAQAGKQPLSRASEGLGSRGADEAHELVARAG